MILSLNQAENMVSSSKQPENMKFSSNLPEIAVSATWKYDFLLNTIWKCKPRFMIFSSRQPENAVSSSTQPKSDLKMRFSSQSKLKIWIFLKTVYFSIFINFRDFCRRKMVLRGVKEIRFVFFWAFEIWDSSKIYGILQKILEFDTFSGCFPHI